MFQLRLKFHWINNIPALVQIMAWRRPGDKSISEPMMVSLPTHICVTRPQWVNKQMELCFMSPKHIKWLSINVCLRLLTMFVPRGNDDSVDLICRPQVDGPPGARQLGSHYTGACLSGCPLPAIHGIGGLIERLVLKYIHLPRFLIKGQIFLWK